MKRSRQRLEDIGEVVSRNFKNEQPRRYKEETVQGNCRQRKIFPEAKDKQMGPVGRLDEESIR